MHCVQALDVKIEDTSLQEFAGAPAPSQEILMGYMPPEVTQSNNVILLIDSINFVIKHWTQLLVLLKATETGNIVQCSTASMEIFLKEMGIDPKAVPYMSEAIVTYIANYLK